MFNPPLAHLYVTAHLFAITGWFSFNQDVPVDKCDLTAHVHIFVYFAKMIKLRFSWKIW